MGLNLRTELDRLNRELLRLTAQRELLVRLIGEDTAPMSADTIIADAGPSQQSRKSSLRPTNPANTQAILEAVAKNPGRTIKEIAKIVGKAQGADKKQIAKLYNTAYGLARRGKLVRDEAHRVRLAD